MKKHSFLIALTAGLLFVSSGCTKKDPEPVEPVTPEIQEEAVDFDLVEYKVYNLDALDYQFVIAKVRIKGEKAVDYSFADLVTSENVKLDCKEEYEELLNKKGISYTQFNLSSEIKSRNNSAVFTLLVPVLDKKAKSVDITLKDKVKITIDLTQNKGTAEDIGMNEDNTVINTENYQIEVLGGHQATGENLFYRGEIVGSSTSNIYVFKVHVTSFVKDPVVITDAEYVSENSSDTFHALSSDYETEKKRNLIDVKVEGEEEAYLFFQVLNPDKQSLTFQGILRIKVNNEWFNVKVDL